MALVTGAGRGIGRGAALGVAARGAAVVVVDIVPEEMARTVSRVRGLGADVLAVHADVRRRAELDRALEEAARWRGTPDILVNSAAVLRMAAFEETDPDLWDETLRVNLDAAYYLAWRLYPAMVARGDGCIITVSSTAAVQPFPRETAYCASKYALEGLIRSLALEAAGRGVCVTLGIPGRRTKPTSMTEAEFAALPPEAQAAYAPPEAFAEAFGYLAAARDERLVGRRFDLWALAELVRDEGWDVSPARALERAERDGV